MRAIFAFVPNPEESWLILFRGRLGPKQNGLRSSRVHQNLNGSNLKGRQAYQPLLYGSMSCSCLCTLVLPSLADQRKAWWIGSA